MPVVLQIAIGGAIGAVFRYLVGVQVSRLAGSAFPWATLAVNVSGSFVMGLAAMVLLHRGDPGLHRYAPFLMTGILGGYTTFSAFSLETVLLVERGRADLALAYAVGSVALSVAAFAAGLWLLRGWAGA
jgi:CrcB protein